MSELFAPITFSDNVTNDIAVSYERRYVTATAMSASTPVFCGFNGSGIVSVNTLAEESIEPEATAMPLLLYKEGSYSYDGGTHYGTYYVIPAVGVANVTFKANSSSITAGQFIVLAGNGKVAGIDVEETTNYQIVVGQALYAVTSNAESDQVIEIKLLEPYAVKLT